MRAVSHDFWSIPCNTKDDSCHSLGYLVYDVQFSCLGQQSNHCTTGTKKSSVHCQQERLRHAIPPPPPIPRDLVRSYNKRQKITTTLGGSISHVYCSLFKCWSYYLALFEILYYSKAKSSSRTHTTSKLLNTTPKMQHKTRFFLCWHPSPPAWNNMKRFPWQNRRKTATTTKDNDTARYTDKPTTKHPIGLSKRIHTLKLNLLIYHATARTHCYFFPLI